jgi:hypothetical protein
LSSLFFLINFPFICLLSVYAETGGGPVFQLFFLLSASNVGEMRDERLRPLFLIIRPDVSVSCAQLWSLFGPSEDGVTIEDGLKEPVLRDRLSSYPLLFGVTKVEMLPYLGEHDSLFGIETERRRDILKGFIEKHFR